MSRDRGKGAALAVGSVLATLVAVGTSLVPGDGGAEARAQDGGAEPQAAAVFVKYDGLDGESTDAEHGKWIDVIALEWAATRHQPSGQGRSRRRGVATTEDLSLVMEYDKASPKLQEAVVRGKVFPKVEIEATASADGGRRPYVRYELTNVTVTGFAVSASGEGRPTIRVGTRFDRVVIGYTPYDGQGASLGTEETELPVERRRR